MAIPLLVEGGTAARAAWTASWSWMSTKRQQFQRLMARDSVTAEQARAILASQASRAARLAAADDVLLNAGTVTELRQAVDRLHERYLELAANLSESRR